MKVAAASFRAFHPDLSTHHSNQLGTDCQSKPGASVLARGRIVRLRERFKDQFVLVGPDSYTRIFDLKVEARNSYGERLRLDLHQNFTFIRELDRVAHQVQQDLAK